MNDVAVRGKLKLKKGSGVSKKKKQKEKNIDNASKCDEVNEAAGATTLTSVDGPAVRKTAAELSFERRQRQLLTQKVMKKAQTSHREKVENFNRYLDNLVEINDIPKVSWTK